MPPTAVRELRALLGEQAVLAGEEPGAREYLHDATISRGVRGQAQAVVRPADAQQVAAVLRWCYEHDVALTARGGGTGFAAGAVPQGGVVLSLERLNAPPLIEPGVWSVAVDAGVTTATLRRRAREQGMYYPPDPGSAQAATIGGNIATNAGGPHTFKYGVTGTWVSGLTVVLAPGEVVTLGGAARKDVAGYDLKSLLIGSEGTLGVVTSATIKLIPAPAAQLPVIGRYPTVAAGCDALQAVLASGVIPAALEFLAIDGDFTLIAEADGSEAEAAAVAQELRIAMATGASSVEAPSELDAIKALWSWRDEISVSVTGRRGGKLSEDIVVPVARLAEAIEQTVTIGERHRLEACSWGHAGDGNLHATFLLDPGDKAQLARAEAAAAELFELAVRLGGSVSGEHGLGLMKQGALALQWSERALELHDEIKRTFDPKGLLNPGKKLAHSPARGNLRVH
jgi:glycolate dehydrogenase FAD-linked subunit